MFSSLRLFTKALRGPFAAQAVSHASKRRDLPILVDITYEEIIKKYLNGNGKIFILKPKRFIAAKLDNNPSFIRKAYRKCTVFKEVVIRRRILPRLPEKRREHFTFAQIKGVEVTIPNKLATQKPHCERFKPGKV